MNTTRGINNKKEFLSNNKICGINPRAWAGLIAIFFCFFYSTKGFVKVQAEKNTITKSNLVYWVKIEGEIDLGLAPFLKRVVQEADEQSIEALILQINTFGGRLDAAVQIRDALINSSTLTIAYINERAISAGALISLSCQKIVMAPAATIGAATPVTISPLDQQMKPASEKVISYFRKEMKATAEKNNRPTLIAEAMVDPDVVIEGLSEKGKLLTLTTSEAVEHKVADFKISGGIENVLQAFHLEQALLKEKKPNWAEKFLRIISGSLLSSLLLSIGLLALFMEFKTPTWGIAGTVGIICLALFFWGHVVLNLVGWEEVILLAVGTILLLLEAFVIPGFGLAGILGILALIAGFSLSMVGKYPAPGEIGGAVSQVSIVFLIVFVFFVLSIKSLSKTALVQRFVLHSRTGHALEMASADSKKGQALQQESETELGLEQKWTHYLGREGIAFTILRPAGKGIFGKERLNIVTEGDFIEKGSSIRVIRVEGKNIIVQKINEA